MQLVSLGEPNFKAAKSLTLGINLSKQIVLLKTQQDSFVVFLGNSLQRKQGLFLLVLSSLSGKDAPQFWVNSRMEVSATQRLYGDQCWDFCPQESHPIGVEDLVLGLKEHENSHTLTTTTTTGSKSSQQEVNNQTDDQNQCCVPPKVPSLLALGLG